jgi:transmembrane sensor
LQEETNHINDELLIKYLLNETSDRESLMVQSWLRADPGNQKRFDEFSLIWETSRNLASTVQMDEHLAWKRMQQRLQKKQEQAPVKRLIPIKPARIAAVFFLLIAGAAIAGIFFIKERRVETRIVKAEKQAISDSLPDGSIVTLNKASALYYPEKFNADSREVKLDGEAFFNITPDKQKPFVIRTGEIEIRVVGTSFNVRNDKGSTEVIVETGIVDVTRNNQTIRLMPEEKVVINKADKLLVKEEVEDKLYNYYASKEFVCVNTPLWKLAEVLNEAYGVHIVIAKKELKRLPLTTTFDNESLDKILVVISQTFNITVDRQGDTIVLN